MSDFYFGTRDYMTWLVCPKIDMPRSKQGWSSTARHLNGGASVYRTLQGARRYEMDWPLRSGGVFDPIHAFAEGVYGDGPFYFLDPQAMRKNIMPAHLAHAFLGVGDGPSLTGWTSPRPVAVANTDQDYKYPARSAQYTLTGSETPVDTWIPVPDGYTFHLGAHGSATGTAGVEYETDNGSSGTVTLLGMNTATRVNTPLVNTGGGVTVRVTGVGTLTLNSIIAVVLKDGKTPQTGDWSTGMGHSGCEFDGFPTDNLYNDPFDLQSTSAVLQEVGAWQS